MKVARKEVIVNGTLETPAYVRSRDAYVYSICSKLIITTVLHFTVYKLQNLHRDVYILLQAAQISLKDRFVPPRTSG